MTSNNQCYSFLTDQLGYETVETKSGKKYFITGYISTSEVDLYNDLVTPAALKSMLKQIMARPITVDYDHEAWRDNISILPVAKIVDAKVDKKGLWVKAQLNNDSPKFKALWGSVKNGFVTAFSIAFKPLKVVTKTMDKAKVRVIEDLKLLNVALTGVPVNQGATIDGYNMKSVFLRAIEESEKPMEEIKMSDKEPEQPGAPAPEPEAPAEPAAEPDQKAKPKKKAKDGEEEEEDDKKKKMDLQPEKKSDDKLGEVIEQLKSLADGQAKLTKEFEELKSKPVFKSLAPAEIPQVEEKSKDMLSLI